MTRLRIVLIVVALLLLLTKLVGQEQKSLSLTHVVSAASHEVDEGYFNLGKELTVLAKPGTDAHSFLVGKLGQSITITFANGERRKSELVR